MIRFNIPFTVNGQTQTITATGTTRIRAGSKNYWYAVFTFADNTFDELPHLSATFSPEPYRLNRGRAKIVPITNGECLIPWEVLARKQKVYVGVFAGDMLVTNEAIIEVTEAAPTAGDASRPTPAWYEQFDAELAAKQDKLIAGDNVTIDENNVISASGGGGGDSYWSLNEYNMLTPNTDVMEDPDIDMANGFILNVERVYFGLYTADTPYAHAVRPVSALPVDAPRTEEEQFVYNTTDNHYYQYDGANWRKLVYADEAGTNDIFWATKDVTTYAEIKTARDAGKLVLYNRNGKLYICLNATDYAQSPGIAGDAFFVSLNEEPNINTGDARFGVLKVSGLGVWNNPEGYHLQLRAITTSLSAQSTDVQYPSAKCVYDAINAAITDAIEEAY